MRKNWLTTLGGIMAGFGLIPIAIGTAANQGIHVSMPGWAYLFCIILGTMGPVVIGVSAKGQDEHSTQKQIDNASTDTAQVADAVRNTGRTNAPH